MLTSTGNEENNRRNKNKEGPDNHVTNTGKTKELIEHLCPTRKYKHNPHAQEKESEETLHRPSNKRLGSVREEKQKSPGKHFHCLEHAVKKVWNK